MDVIRLSPWDLGLAAALVVVLAALSWRARLGVSRGLLIGAVRTAVQLALIGLVLETLFQFSRLHWVALLALAMLLLAGREVTARQRRRLSGIWGFALGTGAMFVSSFSVVVLALTVMVQPAPWYQPQYAIPLLGMLLGNTMSGIALGLDRLTAAAYDGRAAIEARLMLGHGWSGAIAPLRREAMRTGLTPIINAMAAAGIISLPGMMTGQILAGAPPLEAVKYQILIMFLIAGGTGFGTLLAVWFAARRLFDERERLRLDRLAAAR
jgi:putative ABC transport system permease protein